jgi:GABA permease
MWFHPVLSLLTAAAIVGILVQMFLREGTRSRLVLSLLAWGVVLVAFAAQRRAIGDAHLTGAGLAAEARADAWMHEHGAAAELEMDAVVGRDRLTRSSSAASARRVTPTRARDPSRQSA